jgi:hypothetical protein
MSTINTPSTEVAQTPVPEQAATPEPLSKRMEKTVTAQWLDSVAKENASAQTPAAEEAPTAQPAGSEQKAEEAQPELKADDPFTPEQIADPKFWAGLDKAGWEKAVKLHPVETDRVKRAFAASTRIVNEAKNQVKNQPAGNTNEAPANAEPAISPELMDAVQRANSLDARESAKGLKDIVRHVLKDALPEFGFDPNAAKAQSIMRNAYASVVADLPETSTIDGKELDAVIDADPHLTKMIATADTLPDAPRTEIYASVMRKAVDTVIASKKSESDAAALKAAAENKKKAEEQKRVRSNVNIASNSVVESPSGGAPQGKKSIRESVLQKWNEAAAAENGG